MQVYFKQIDWALKEDSGVGVVQSSTIPEGRKSVKIILSLFLRAVSQLLRLWFLCQ